MYASIFFISDGPGLCMGSMFMKIITAGRDSALPAGLENVVKPFCASAYSHDLCPYKNLGLARSKSNWDYSVCLQVTLFWVSLTQFLKIAMVSVGIRY
jgi:hypothetical protein